MVHLVTIRAMLLPLGYDNSQTYEFEGIIYPTAIFEEEPYPVPILSIDNEEHHISAKQMGSLYVNNTVIDHAIDGQNTYCRSYEFY